MINEAHVLILDAYIARLTISDLEKIVEAKKASAQAALNYGNRAQLEAMANRTQVVRDSMGNMIQWDRDIISRVVNNVVAGEV